MVLVSLIKMFKEPTLFYCSRIKSGDSVRQRYLSSAVVIANMSRTHLLTARAHIPAHAARLSASSRAAGVRAGPPNQTVDTSNCGHTRRLPLPRSVALGWYVEDLVTRCLFNFKRLRQG